MSEPDTVTGSSSAGRLDRRDLYLALSCALLTLGVLLVYKPWSQATQGDIAMFQAFGKLIADGKVPYADFFDQKTPLASYLNAGVAVLSGWFGFDYVLGARGLSVVIYAAGGGIMYLLAREAGLDRVPSVAAAGLFSALDFFAWAGAIGLEPKALEAIVGVAALVAAYRGRWLLSGALSALALLAWQPAGVVVVAAGSYILLRSERRAHDAALLVAGFAMPLLVIGVYMLATGALDDMWADVVTFNRSYVGDPPWPPPVGHVRSVVDESYPSDRWLLLVAVAGFVVWAAAAGVALVRRARVRDFAPQVPIVVLTLLVLGYTAVNFGDLGDILPFVPLVAFWPAWLLQWTSRRVAWNPALLALVGAVVLVGYAQHTLLDQNPLQQAQPTLAWQRDRVHEIESMASLQDGDATYIVNTPWFLLLSDRKHFGPYYYFWNGADIFAIDRQGGGILTGPIARERPKLVAVGQGAEWVLEPALVDSYRQLDRAKVGDYRFPDSVSFWVRADSVQNETALLPALPRRTTDSLCQESDLGDGYRAENSNAAGWRDITSVSDTERQSLTRLGFVQGYSQRFVGASTQPAVTCSVALFNQADSGSLWVRQAKSNLCSSCRELPAPGLGDEALMATSLEEPGRYGVRLLLSRSHLLVNVTVSLQTDAPPDVGALSTLAVSQADDILNRFRF